ncbi:MAG: peptide transporter, partial [Salinisphaera sp.]|nr:peptide transporter [Salinisphaera sp.]
RDWGAAREHQPVPVVGLDRPTIERDLAHIAQADYAVIDGAPQYNDLARSAIKAAQYVLIPVQPSPYDVWATSDLVDRVRDRIELTDGALAAGFVVSRAIAGTRIGSDVRAALVEYGLPVLDTVITQRVIYPNSAAVGATVYDYPARANEKEAQAAAVAEMDRLVDEVTARISEGVPV